MANFYYFFNFCLEEQSISRLKILFTIPNFDTAGSGKALFNIAKNLDINLFEPHICCSHNRGEFFQIVKSTGIPVHIHNSTHEMIPRLRGLSKCFQLANYFKNIGIDLVHSFHYGSDYSEALSAKFAGIPWIYTKKNMNWGGSSKNSWRLRTIFASHILAQNTDMLRSFFPKSKKVTLVPRGVDIVEFQPRKVNFDLLNKFKIAKNEKVILCVANLHPVKGINVLFDAFHKLPNKLNDLHLLIVGDKENEMGIRLEKMVQKSNKSDKIHISGKVSNVNDYYSIADLFVLPTLDQGRREGCPVALLEAIASGLFVFGSNIAGIKDILRPFPSNLFQAGNSDELAKKISDYFVNKYPNINDDLLKHVRDSYSIKVEAKNHEDIYKNLLV